MRNRWYVVGAPIMDPRVHSFLTFTPKNLTQTDLEQSSFFKEETMILFTSCDQAKEYAHGLQQHAAFNINKDDATFIVKKIYPIFTINFSINVKLEKFHLKQLTYLTRSRSGIEKEHQMTFYVHQVQSATIPRTAIIRAEFYYTDMPSIEFENSPKQACVIS